MSNVFGVSIRSSLRKFAIMFLKFTNFDFYIQHHWIDRPRKIFLNSFLHKAYWYHGRKRETTEMLFYAKVLRPGDVVVEVGGHIGYVSAYLCSLVGKGGKIFVFEPSLINRKYIEKNVFGENAVVIFKGAGGEPAFLEFKEDTHSSQTGTFNKDFRHFERNVKSDGVSFECKKSRIEVVRVDSVQEISLCERIRLLKIDCEGFEWEVLQGCQNVLSKVDFVYVEITFNAFLIRDYLAGYGFFPFTVRGDPVVFEGMKFDPEDNNYFLFGRMDDLGEIGNQLRAL